MIRIDHITLQRGRKIVLDEANVTIQNGEKVGLIGRNGAGKSSLFALLLGQLSEERGEVKMPQHWVLTQVQQEMPKSDLSATDFVLSGDARLMQAQQALVAAQAADDGLALAKAHTLLEEAQAFTARARAQSLLLGLGFTGPQLGCPVNHFSGGWRMRLQLARALMSPADLLLLDEPTNHLDLDALVWLEDWLQRFSGTLLLISHDKFFLDAVCKVTLHLDKGKITRYGSNYSGFEVLQASALALQAAAYQKQQTQIAHLEQFITRFKAKASKARQAQSRVKALARMQHLAPVLASADFSFVFQEPAALPNPMLRLRDASLGYNSTTPILQSVACNVLAGQRIGILGANGQGKSTFVKSVAGLLPLLDGHISLGKGLRIGYFAQHELDILEAGDTPLQALTRISLAHEDNAAVREQDLRNFLGQFQFSGAMMAQSIGSMSGGEKSRLVLALLVWQKPSLLLLDEPTNHLDLSTRQALSLALNQFEGTVMLVSHDRALLSEVCDEFWLVADAGLKPFEGDLNDYQKYLLIQARQRRESLQTTQNPASKKSSKEERRAAALARANLQPLKAHLRQLENQLDQYHQKQKTLEQQLQTERNPDALAGVGKRLKSIQAETAVLEEKWLTLGVQLEANPS